MFNVGDLIVFLSRKSDDTDLYTVEAILDDGQFLGISDYRKAFPSSSFRHATPEEIAAGHRIESNNGQAINHSCVSDFQENKSQIGLPIKQECQCKVLDMVDVSPRCEVRNG